MVYLCHSNPKEIAMMKKISLILLALLASLTSFAQVDSHYGVGAVPVVNNRVTFEKTIPLTKGQTEKGAYDKATQWMVERFVEPTVLSKKVIQQDDTNHHLVIQAEEYLTFKRRWWVLDRTRINYLLEIMPADGGLTVRMTRIKYWYEEERDGGQRFTAEEWITDEQCFNESRTKFFKATGKFRIKTIDLFDSFVNELTNRL